MNNLYYNGSLFTKKDNKYSITDMSNKTIIVQDKDGKTESFPMEYWGRILNETALPYAGSNESDLIKNIDFLHARLDFLRKTVTYWDTFNIQGVISTQNDVNKIYDMDINSTLIVAGKNLKWENTVLSSGDSIIKDSTSNYHIIPSNSSGVFKPQIKISENNKVEISYSPDDNWVQDLNVAENLSLNTAEVYYNINGRHNNNGIYRADGEYQQNEIKKFNIDSCGFYYTEPSEATVNSEENLDQTLSSPLSSIYAEIVFSDSDKIVKLKFNNLHYNIMFTPVIKFYYQTEEICLHHTFSYGSDDNGNKQWVVEWKCPSFDYEFKVK